MKVEASVEIRRSAEDVFDAFSDISSIESRVPAIKKVEILSEQQQGLGTRWRETRVMMGKEATEEMEITHQETPTLQIVEAASHGTEYKTTYRFLDAGGATRIEMVFEGTPQTVVARLMSPLAWLMKGSIQKMLLADMEAVRDALETEVA